MNIIKFVMFETNGAIDMPSRPYEVDLRDGVNGIINDLDHFTQGGTTINGATIARLSSGILVPSTRARDTKIDGGWRERRIIFAMVVETETLDRYRDIRYISGYTDRSDYAIDSHGNVLFPEDMRLYFNSVTKITMTEIASRSTGGRSIKPTVRDNNLLLRKDSIRSDKYDADQRPGRNSIRNPLLLRPQDILRRKSSVNVLSSLLGDNSANRSINGVGQFVRPTILSRRKNNNSAEYLATTIGKYVEARSMGEDDASNSGFIDQGQDNDYLSQASIIASEDIMSNDVLYDKINRASSMFDLGYVEWGELKRMAPDFDEHRDLPFTTWKAREKAANRRYRDSSPDGRSYTSGMVNYENSASFYDTSVESMCSLMIAQAIPQILIDSMYSGIEGLTLTSHPQRGEPTVHMSMAFPFVNGIPVEYGFNYLKSQMANVVLPNVTKNGSISIEAIVNASIDQDIEVWISVDGGPEEYRAYPVWAESLIPPLVTDDVSDLESISSNVAGLLEDFAVVMESKSNRHIELASSKEIFGRETRGQRLDIAPDNERSSSRSSRRDSDYEEPLNLNFGL